MGRFSGSMVEISAGMGWLTEVSTTVVMAMVILEDIAPALAVPNSDLLPVVDASMCSTMMSALDCVTLPASL